MVGPAIPRLDIRVRPRSAPTWRNLLPEDLAFDCRRSGPRKPVPGGKLRFRIDSRAGGRNLWDIIYLRSLRRSRRFLEILHDCRPDVDPDSLRATPRLSDRPELVDGLASGVAEAGSGCRLTIRAPKQDRERGVGVGGDRYFTAACRPLECKTGGCHPGAAVPFSAPRVRGPGAAAARTSRL